MTWFINLTGFPEVSPEDVRQHLRVDGELMISQVNGRSFRHGRLQIPTLADLRQQALVHPPTSDRLTLREQVANVQTLHTDPANAGALFQVASQFNLLEMVSPSATPERGVGIYEHDHTQGPACAIAAGAGTIYRNYFAPVNGRIGQTADNQIDCLADLGQALGNTGNRLWRMQNGYALATRSGLAEISQRLAAAGEAERDDLRQRLRIGLQWDTQVTLDGCAHTVSQAYCSALPVAYSDQPAALWEPFARLVLEAAYEATLCAAIINQGNGGSDRLYLTLLGGGAFGNQPVWIADALTRALRLYAGYGLDVALVSYGRSSPHVQAIIADFSGPS